MNQIWLLRSNISFDFNALDLQYGYFGKIWWLLLFDYIAGKTSTKWVMLWDLFHFLARTVHYFFSLIFK